MKERPTFFRALAVSPVVPALLLAAWFGGLWLLSSLPGNEVSLPHYPHADKVAHFLYFLGGGFLSAWLLRCCRENWKGLRLVVAVTALIAAVGAFDELHQTFTPGRSGGDVGDWVADVAGGLAGAGLFVMIYGLVTRTTHPGTPAGN